MAGQDSQRKRWLPLESNPAVLNEFAERIGMTDANYRFCDVFGLDPVSSLPASPQYFGTPGKMEVLVKRMGRRSWLTGTARSNDIHIHWIAHMHTPSL